MAYRKLNRDEHFKVEGPKRILALDGGGLRGILSLGYLRKIEDILRARAGGDPAFRLAHYFDLIAGTSTGAIIAAALAKGLTVGEITRHYLQMGRDVFRDPQWYDPKRFLRGIFVPKYNKGELVGLLKEVLGESTTLGSPDLLTGLLVVTKRVDTGSPWPLGNNPDATYFKARPDSTTIPNADYPLWQVVRASTAAPTYFEPEALEIGAGPGGQRGQFVDGGVSPSNNPALQAYMYATLNGYGVRWPSGAEQLLIVSVGTGTDGPEIKDSKVVAIDALKALGGLMDDCASLVETMMQWMSDSPSARRIDRELGTLAGDLLGGKPLFHYMRYNVMLTAAGLAGLGVTISGEQMGTLASMDKPANLTLLKEVGEAAADRQVTADHFPPAFDLT